MDSDSPSPLDPQRNYSTDPELTYSEEEKEWVQRPPTQICRHCNNRWREPEPLSTPAIAVPRVTPTFKQRCMSSYHQRPWLYRSLLLLFGAIVVMAIILAVIFRSKPPTGVYGNGTGMVALDRGDTSQMVDIFYEHASGQIRHIVLDDLTQKWSGGTAEDNILGPSAPPPRHGTPLMAVSYAIGNETTWRVFYVDSSGFLQESISSNTSGDFPTQWLPGPLGLGQLKAHSSSHTGLSVCKNMLWSADALGLNNGSIVLFYGGEDGRNHMLTHVIQDTVWKDTHRFEDSSAASGIECTSRGDRITDAWMINSQGQLTQASFNFDPTFNSSVYPAGAWTSGVVYDGAIQVPTSISAIKYSGNTTTFETNSTFVHFVGPDGIVREINVKTYDRSRAPTTTRDSWDIGDLQIASGSKIASVDLRTSARNLETSEFGEDSKIFLQFADDPRQISVMSRNFADNPTSFVIGEVSNVQG